MLTFADSFDTYNTGDAIAQIRYRFGMSSISANWTFAPAGGRFGGGALCRIRSNTGDMRVSNIWSTDPTIDNFVAFWMKIDIASASRPILGNGFGNAFFSYDSFGKPYVSAMGSPGTVLGVGSSNLADSEWHWVELRVRQTSNNTGGYTVYVDGIKEIDVSNVQTVATTVVPTPSISFLGSDSYGSGSPGTATSVSMTYDDLIVWTSEGSSFNTFPIGPSRINGRRPTGPGASTGFTVEDTGGRPNWQVVDIPLNGAINTTTYIKDDGEQGKVDLYTTANPDYTPKSVKGVAVGMFGNTDYHLAPALQAQVGKSSATASGNPVRLPAGNRRTSYSWVSNAPSGAAWTPEDIVDLQIGQQSVLA